MKLHKNMFPPAIALVAVLVLGFSLRLMYLDLPSIGYHNMKENEWLSMAQEMRRTGDYLTRRVYFEGGLTDTPGISSNREFPVMAYHVLAAWSILGENLWGPRLINVLFGAAAVLILFRIGLILFASPAGALWASLLLAVSPLAVFFSRNIQGESPAFFFMLLGTLFHLRFVSSSRKYNLALSGLSFIISWIYRPNFLIAAIPLFFCVPYAKIKEGKGFKVAMTYLFAPYVLLISFIIMTSQAVFNPTFDPRIFDIFRPGYWQQAGKGILIFAINENFTLTGSLLACCGLLLACVRNRGLLNRYLIGLIPALVLYGMLYPSELSQNSFYQMPFLGGVCLSAAYAVTFITSEARKYVKQAAPLLVAVIVIGSSVPQVRDGLMRIYGTVFLGADVAGETLKELTRPDERIFLYTHPQGNAVARYARRYVGWPATLQDMLDTEKKYGVRFVCFFPGDFFHMFRQQNPDMFAYIEKNYVVREVGLLENPDRLGYMIMEKSPPKKPLDETLKQLAGRKEPRSIYRVFGRFIFFYSLRPVDDEAVSDQGHDTKSQDTSR